MPDGEVKIHIAAEADSKKIEDMMKRIQELRRVADAYDANNKVDMGGAAKSARGEANALAREVDRMLRSKLAAKRANDAKNDPLEMQRATIAKGMVEEGAARAAGNTAAADAMRSEVDVMEEALGLQKKHGISQKDAFLIARSKRAEEQYITRELKVQSALLNAGIGRRGIAQAVGVGGQILSGGNPASSASSMLMQIALASRHPVAIAAAVSAATATGLAGASSNQAEWEKMQLLQQNTRIANTKFDMRRQQGVFGSSAGLQSMALDAEKEVDARRNARPELVEKARVKWEAPSTWKGILGFKTDGQKELEESDAKSADAQLRMAEAQNAAKERYRQTEGGLELDMLRQRSKRSLAGQRAAFVDEEAGKGFAKYNEARHQGASESMANEMATLTYKNDLRDRQASAGAGLVDARSGGAGVAAAAQWAIQGTGRSDEIGGKLETLIGAVHQGNQSAQIVHHAK